MATLPTVFTIERACLSDAIFGKVMKARVKATGEVVAVKVYDKNLAAAHRTRLGAPVLEDLDTELKVMNLLAKPQSAHPNLMAMHPAASLLAERERVAYSVAAFAEGGDLLNHLKRVNVSHATAKSYFVQLLSAIRHLHSLGWHHRDISLENVLMMVTPAGGLKPVLCDYGLALPASDDLVMPSLRVRPGKQSYMAPEIFAFKPYHSAAADVYSLGVVLFGLLSRSLPYTYPSSSSDAAFRMIQAGQLSALLSAWQMADRFDADSLDLITRMLALDPAKRPTMAQVAAHPWCAAACAELEASLAPALASAPVAATATHDGKECKTAQEEEEEEEDVVMQDDHSSENDIENDNENDDDDMEDAVVEDVDMLDMSLNASDSTALAAACTCSDAMDLGQGQDQAGLGVQHGAGAGAGANSVGSGSTTASTSTSTSMVSTGASTSTAMTSASGSGSSPAVPNGSPVAAAPGTPGTTDSLSSDTIKASSHDDFAMFKDIENSTPAKAVGADSCTCGFQSQSQSQSKTTSTSTSTSKPADGCVACSKKLCMSASRPSPVSTPGVGLSEHGAMNDRSTPVQPSNTSCTDVTSTTTGILGGRRRTRSASSGLRLSLDLFNGKASDDIAGAGAGSGRLGGSIVNGKVSSPIAGAGVGTGTGAGTGTGTGTGSDTGFAAGSSATSCRTAPLFASPTAVPQRPAAATTAATNPASTQPYAGDDVLAQAAAAGLD